MKSKQNKVNNLTDKLTNTNTEKQTTTSKKWINSAKNEKPEMIIIKAVIPECQIWSPVLLVSKQAGFS